MIISFSGQLDPSIYIYIYMIFDFRKNVILELMNLNEVLNGQNKIPECLCMSTID